MYDEQVRINAMISYFFLGPIFLLARPGGPLADPYVRIHAKRSSIILILGVLGYIGYTFLKPVLIWNIANVALASVVLGSLVGILVGYLIYSAYGAYHGDILTGTGTQHSPIDFFQKDTTERTDGEKIRIIASFVPLLGIWLSSKYDESAIRLGRKIGTCAFLLIITSSLFLDGSTGLSLILTLLTIILIVFSGVSLFSRDTLPVFIFYNWIPSYVEIESHIRTVGSWIWGVFRVLGGREQEKSYKLLYEEKLGETLPVSYTQTFPLSPRIIGIPILNLFLLPFLFQERYSEYRDNILQGITLTGVFIAVWMGFGFQSGLEAYLMIPLISLVSSGSLSPNARIAGVSFILIITHIFKRTQTHIETLQSKEEDISYSYPESAPKL